MSNVTRYAHVMLLLLVAAPVSAQRVRITAGDSLQVDLDSSRTVVALGVSWYGDVLLLYPAVASDAIVPAGRSTRPLSYHGPWLRGGKPRLYQSTASGYGVHCTNSGLWAQVHLAATGERLRQHCTWLPPAVDVGLRYPVIRHLVVLVGDPVSAPLPLDEWLAKVKIPGSTQAVATAIGARLDRVDSARTWTAHGIPFVRQTPVPSSAAP